MSDQTNLKSATVSEATLTREYEEPIEPVGYDFGLSRRGFVQFLSAGLLIASSAHCLSGRRTA